MSSFGGQPLFSNSLKSTSANKVKRISKINEGDIQWSSLFTTFLLQLSDRDYHVYCGSPSSEATF